MNNKKDEIMQDVEIEEDFSISIETNRQNKLINLDTLNEDLSEEGLSFDSDFGVYNVFLNIDKVQTDVEGNKVLDNVLKCQIDLVEENYKDEMLYSADSYSEDLCHSIELMLNDYHYTRDTCSYSDEVDAYYMHYPTYSGCLQRFFVNPEYRNKGIAQNILDNLDHLLRYSLNLNIRCIVTYIKPDKGQEDNMEDIMKHKIKTLGFEAMKENNFYIKDYFAKYDD